jgi:hypothetical protein
MKIFSNGGKIGFTGQNNNKLYQSNITLDNYSVSQWDIETSIPKIYPIGVYGSKDDRDYKAELKRTVKITLTLEAPVENMKVYGQIKDDFMRKEIFGVPKHIPDSQTERYVNRIAR